MDYRQIIATAWNITRENKRLIKWYAFAPAMIATAMGILEFLYQVIAFKKANIFSNEHHASFAYEILQFIIAFFQNHTSLSIALIPLLIFLVFFSILFPPFAKAACVQIVARIYNGQNVLLRDGVKYGSDSFMRMLGYEATIKHFSVLLIITVFCFVIRTLGIEALRMLWLPFILAVILALIISVLLTYTEYYIVIDNLSISESIWKSLKMVLYYWEHTLLLMILMIIIGARIILNAAFVLLIPSIILVSTTYIAAITLYQISLVIGLILGGLAFVLASYINAIVDIWSISVWTITFLKLTAEGDKSARETEKNANKEILKIRETPALTPSETQMAL